MTARARSSILPVLAVFIVLAVSGCTLKSADSNAGTGKDINQQAVADQNDSANQVPRDPGSPIQGGPEIPDAPETNRALKVLSPILCNDYLIVRSIEKRIGESYSITRVPPAAGSFFQTASCLIKKGNIAQASYYTVELADEVMAIESLEDEKKQYEQQLFNVSVQEASGFGAKAYLFELPVKEGSLYRVIFTDATNRKVAVFMKSSTVLDKEFMLDIARAIEEAI